MCKPQEQLADNNLKQCLSVMLRLPFKLSQNSKLCHVNDCNGFISNTSLTVSGSTSLEGCNVNRHHYSSSELPQISVAEAAGELQVQRREVLPSLWHREVKCRKGFPTHVEMVAFQDVNVPTSTEPPWFAVLNLVNTMVDAGEKSHYGMWPHTICGICGLQPLLTSGLEYVIKPTEFIKNDWWQTTLETLALSCNTPFIPGREVLIGGCGDEGGSVEARSVALMDKRMTHELYQ
ncbi:hypothetical protein Cadr_000002213 [Camelus dromedarius]|uniref:Uncharacterized protein n=1 Tax=Camelus dromedarius TaxID=9838 RepID=A0A5N4EGV3_CAMDR|nr:hypothetical protein Cadr_000002213 [Camelus dromedarius]